MADFPISNLVPSAPDDRDYRYIPLQSGWAREADLRPFETPVEDQLSLGSCVSNSITESCELLRKRAGAWDELSRLFLNYNTHVIENTVGQQGVQLRDGLISARHSGICDEATWQYIEANDAVEPPPAAYTEGARQVLDRYERIYHWTEGAPSDHMQQIFNGIQSALAEGLPVVIALKLGEQFRSISGPLLQQNYPNVSGSNPYIGNHAMCIEGFRDLTFPYGVIAKNSWGTGWGDQGHCLLGWGVIVSDLLEAWAIRGFEGADIKPTPGIYLSNLDRYNLSARIVPPTPGVFNVWVGAKLADGQIMLKVSDESWQPLLDGQYIPYRSQALLGESAEIDVAENFDLAPYAGADVYVAYGDSPFTWQLSKICTVKAIQ